MVGSRSEGGCRSRRVRERQERTEGCEAGPGTSARREYVSGSRGIEFSPTGGKGDRVARCPTGHSRTIRAADPETNGNRGQGHAEQGLVPRGRGSDGAPSPGDRVDPRPRGVDRCKPGGYSGPRPFSRLFGPRASSRCRWGPNPTDRAQSPDSSAISALRRKGLILLGSSAQGPHRGVGGAPTPPTGLSRRTLRPSRALRRKGLILLGSSAQGPHRGVGGAPTPPTGLSRRTLRPVETSFSRL